MLAATIVFDTVNFSEVCFCVLCKRLLRGERRLARRSRRVASGSCKLSTVCGILEQELRVTRWGDIDEDAMTLLGIGGPENEDQIGQTCSRFMQEKYDIDRNSHGHSTRF